MWPWPRSRKKIRGKPDKRLPGLEWINPGLVDVRWQGWRPRLVVHEKYEARIKWTLRGLTALGILSALVSLEPAVGLGLGVGLFLLEQFFERAVFQYTTIVVTPFPDFRLHHEDITAMAFAWPHRDRPNHPDMAGLCFTTEAMAGKVFDLLLALNYGEREDRDDNIRLSFVWSQQDGKDGYYVCIYANPNRRSVEETFARTRQVGYEKKPGKEQQELVLMWTFAKRFGGDAARLREFLARQRPDRPFWLQAFRATESGGQEILFTIKPILKWHLRVLDENQLTKEDQEYWLVFR